MAVSDNSDDYPDDPLGISGDELCLRNEVERLRAENERLERRVVQLETDKRQLEKTVAVRGAGEDKSGMQRAAAKDTGGALNGASVISAAYLQPVRELLNAINQAGREPDPKPWTDRALFFATALELCAVGSHAVMSLEPADGRHLDEQFDLLERINLAVEPHCAALERRCVDLALTVDDGTPQYVMGDPLRLEQRLSLLIGAQAKRLAEGDELGVRIKPGKNSTSSHLCVDFIVSGIKRGSAAAAADAPGSGEEFSCELCEVAAGKLCFRARVGCYAVYEFSAVLQPGVPAGVERAATSIERDAARRALRVLVAEDSPLNQRLVASILQRRGHQVEIAENGLEAIAKFDESPYDVVITDIQMPEMDGFQLTSEIRLRDKAAGKHTPVIASTIRALRGDKALCLSSGMDGYIAKPIHADELVSLIEETFWALYAGCQ